MHTIADLAKSLNRSTIYLTGQQSRFEIPTLDGEGYSEPTSGLPSDEELCHLENLQAFSAFTNFTPHENFS